MHITYWLHALKSAAEVHRLEEGVPADPEPHPPVSQGVPRQRQPRGGEKQQGGALRPARERRLARHHAPAHGPREEGGGQQRSQQQRGAGGEGLVGEPQPREHLELAAAAVGLAPA